MDGHGTKRRRKIAENFHRLSMGARTLQTDDRQAHGTAIAYSEREREFTFAEKPSLEVAPMIIATFLSNRDFSAVFICLQFPLQVCFSPMVP